MGELKNPKVAYIEATIDNCEKYGIECAFRLDGVTYGSLPVEEAKVKRTKHFHWGVIDKMVATMKEGDQFAFQIPAENKLTGADIDHLQSAVCNSAAKYFGKDGYITKRLGEREEVVLSIVIKQPVALNELCEQHDKQFRVHSTGGMNS